MKKVFVLAVCLLLVSLVSAIDISNCANLNTAGATYTLTANATATGTSNCFTFSANNIVLDCNGHFATTTTGTGAVINGQSNSSIKNCNFNSSVNGKEISIAISSTANCDVNITNTTGTLGYPIAFFNSSVNLADQVYSSLWICGGNNSNLTRTKVFSLNETATDVAPDDVFIYFSDNVTLDSINFTGAKSVYLLNSSWIIMKNSYIFAGDIQHLNIDLNSPFTSFFNNTLVSAFAEFLMNNGTIENNSFLYSDMPVNPDSAIYCSGSNNTITNNIIDKTSDFSLSGNNSAITRNNFTDNSQLSVQGYNNTIYGNIMNGSDFQQALANFAYLHIQPSSGNNSIHDNNLTSIRLGIEGNNNQIYNNILNVTYNGNPMWPGIYTNGDGNLFYNNYFGQIQSDFLGANFWNTSRQAGTRIYSPGTDIGGNFWADSGGGYSETCTDSNTDGFCDNSYVNGSLGTITDYLPLSNKYTVPSSAGSSNVIPPPATETPPPQPTIEKPNLLKSLINWWKVETWFGVKLSIWLLILGIMIILVDYTYVGKRKKLSYLSLFGLVIIIFALVDIISWLATG